MLVFNPKVKYSDCWGADITQSVQQRCRAQLHNLECTGKVNQLPLNSNVFSTSTSIYNAYDFIVTSVPLYELIRESRGNLLMTYCEHHVKNGGALATGSNLLLCGLEPVAKLNSGF